MFSEWRQHQIYQDTGNFAVGKNDKKSKDILNILSQILIILFRILNSRNIQ